MSLSSHTAVLAAGKESWTIASAPSTLKVGSTWELDGDNGDHRTLRIEKTDGTHATISGVDNHHPGITFTLDGSRTADGWTIERVRFAPQHDGDKHYFTLQFNTPLNAAATASTMDLTIGRKARVATASLTLAGTANDRTVHVQMQSPPWVRGKDLQERTNSTSAGTTTVSVPAAAAASTNAR